MKIRKGDNVMVMSGKDRGKSGKVVLALPKKGTVLIEGINMKRKHQGPKRSDQKGQVIDKPMPVNVSNVMLIDPSNGKPSRVGKKLIGEKYERIAKRSGATI